jgi:hypothetical protein
MEQARENTSEKAVPVRLPIGQWVTVIVTLVGFLVGLGWMAHKAITDITDLTKVNANDIGSHYSEFQAFRQAEEDRWRANTETLREVSRTQQETARAQQETAKALERLQGKLDR